MSVFSPEMHIYFSFTSSGDLAAEIHNSVVIKDSWTHDERTLEGTWDDVCYGGWNCVVCLLVIVRRRWLGWTRTRQYCPTEFKIVVLA